LASVDIIGEHAVVLRSSGEAALGMVPRTHDGSPNTKKMMDVRKNLPGQQQQKQTNKSEGEIKVNVSTPVSYKHKT
jgi:hypothetical protein